VRIIAGADVAFDKPRGRGVAVVVALAWPGLEEVRRVCVEAPVTFPYVPGLLSFRETPLLMVAFEQLDVAPDLLMVDGHGYAHPRRFGYASHLGLLLDLPTIGVAKSILIGAHQGVGEEAGGRADLVDSGEVIGAAVRTRERVRPVYVSVGHRIDLDAAVAWVLRCARGRRVPEPTRVADALTHEMKRRMLEATLEMVVEQRAGEAGRWEWVKEDEEVVFRHDLPPMPAHYGCSTEYVNPADGELLDIMLVDRDERARGERLDVRVIDVLRRSDGDDKLLALPADADGAWAWPRLDALRAEIFDWYVARGKPVTHWGGEDDAIDVIRSCRGDAAAWRGRRRSGRLRA